MIRPTARRDFLLDSGAITYLASHPSFAQAWFELITERFEAPAVFVFADVVTEALTGDPRRDANTNRLLKRVEATSSPTSCWLDVPPTLSARAAMLRTVATTRRTDSTKRPISITDAHLVALAEERSSVNAVTILTTDPLDIRHLVDLTGATNFAVQGL